MAFHYSGNMDKVFDKVSGKLEKALFWIAFGNLINWPISAFERFGSFTI